MEESIIVGAGLSGLSTAYYLKKSGVNALVLEARDRTGGRIYTPLATGNNTAVEMGATWFNDRHTYLIQLLKELNLTFFRQFQAGISIFDLPPNPHQFFDMASQGEASYRIAGGTSTLTQALFDAIGPDQILLNAAITEVLEKPEYIIVKTKQGKEYNCRQLVFTIPPFLLSAQKIKFSPALPAAIGNLMQQTHTWMGDAIKFALEYKQAFWREKGYSGTIISQSGIAPEVYDHCNYKEDKFALMGFLNPEIAHLSPATREARTVAQLARVLGTEANNYLSYTEKVWSNDPYTYAEYGKYLLPHQHNGHPLYQQALMNNKLYLAGTETSPHFGGYMEGAVYKGITTARSLSRK